MRAVFGANTKKTLNKSPKKKKMLTQHLYNLPHKYWTAPKNSTVVKTRYKQLRTRKLRITLTHWPRRKILHCKHPN